MVMDLDMILRSVQREVEHASKIFPPFHNAHEGYAVLLEEVDELWDAVKLNQHRHPERDKEILHEAIHVAAMAVRLIMDCYRREGEL